MINVTLADHTQIICFWLIFIRWSSIIIQLPLFDQTSIPVTVKTLFSMMITFCFYPSLKHEVLKDLNYLGSEHFFILTFFYLVIGLIIGFMVKSLLSIFTGSGSLINQQIGFGAVHYFDPTTSSQMGPLEKLIQWTIIVIILTSGAVTPMLKGIYLSFFSIHIHDLGKIVFSPLFFIEMFKNIFLLSLMLAGPLIFTNMLITIILGILSRVVPQMNIIMVSLVINIGLGSFIFASNSHEFFHMAFQIYTEQLGKWFQFVT